MPLVNRDQRFVIIRVHILDIVVARIDHAHVFVDRDTVNSGKTGSQVNIGFGKQIVNVMTYIGDRFGLLRQRLAILELLLIGFALGNIL